MALIITDLDNTLYDWVSFFAIAFDAMVTELEALISVKRSILLEQFKVVHQRYGNAEQPFAILELPAVEAAFPNMPPGERLKQVRGPIDAFNAARDMHLRLYDTVEDSLGTLNAQGHVVVGHTEAILLNAYFRMRKLGINRYFSRLYALEGKWPEHPMPDRQGTLSPPDDFVRTIPREERKPNPQLLRDICRREGAMFEESVFVGDSLTRDVSMAKEAGVCAVWARYGTRYKRDHWQLLVSVTNWTDDEVKREGRLRKKYHSIQPDFTIESFGEILGILTLLGLAVG